MLITNLQKLLLKNRGVQTEEEMRAFLKPNYKEELGDPFILPDMQKAVERIFKAISKKEKIIIYADYDCDGIPGAVVLSDFFKKINYTNFSVYIPHRHKEGYGLNNLAIENFAKEKVSLIITIDLAITNIKEIDYANEFKIDVIVTDHHLPHNEVVGDVTVQILPKAYAIINAKRSDNIYKDNMLCGAATAWKLACALLEYGRNLEKENISDDSITENIKQIPEGYEKWWLDMVAISTISDLVPLVKENRLLAYYGLTVLRKTKRLGALELFKKAGIKLEYLTEEDIAFSIAPRINAASRMDNPIEAFLLFAAKDEGEAKLRSDYLDSLNDKRKENVATFMKKAYKIAENQKEQAIIVLGDLSWSPGVLGLIASKILDEHKKTVFVWGKGDESESIKGSCRSDGFVHLVDLMSATENLFLHMGGHELAGGFSLSYNKIHDLESGLLTAYEKIRHSPLVPADKDVVDCELSIDDVNIDIYNEIQPLAPFGVANQKPLFIFKDIFIEEIKDFGKEKNHLEISFKNQRGKIIKAIAFFMNQKSINDKLNNKEGKELGKGSKISITGNIELSTFAGRKEIRLRLKNITI
jgi:single-stranded-DNA-specific exonuclease